MTPDPAEASWRASSPEDRAEKFRYSPSASIIRRDWDFLSEFEKSSVRRAFSNAAKKSKEGSDAQA